MMIFWRPASYQPQVQFIGVDPAQYLLQRAGSPLLEPVLAMMRARVIDSMFTARVSDDPYRARVVPDTVSARVTDG